MHSEEIRNTFLEFFVKNDHLKILGSSIIPKNDPSLLFINAGMAPLKNYFLGTEKPPKNRLCNVQPCIRTKDIDDVGDRYHLTLFEMLGSWSIGDYFKEKAVELAYDLLVNWFKFDKNKLFVSVYKGNNQLKIDADMVSFNAWKNVGIEEGHILMMGDDNFWSAGDNGPCGPCTEVYFDTGSSFGKDYDGINFDTSRFIEIWNAGVFMEFNKAGNIYQPLKIKSVDTGSGLERMTMVLNNKNSVYETDLLDYLVTDVVKQYNVNESTSRMIADHLRAITFILGEHVSPSNEGQGYIPRKLIRRMITPLASQKIDFYDLIDKVTIKLKPYYNFSKDLILKELDKEIKEFLPVISKGVKMLLDTPETIDGKTIFDLVTSLGLPLNIIKDFAKDANKKLDLSTYNKLYEEHRSVSKGGVKVSKDINLPSTKFVGYEVSETIGTVLDYFDNYLVTDVTPFYGESGGQIGDSGKIIIDGIEVEILDTKKIDDVYLHQTTGEFDFKKGKEVKLVVDTDRQNALKRAHSSAHLLHAVLQSIYGKNATQSGSLIRPDIMRFDYKCNSLPTKDEQKQIELKVNELILSALENKTLNISLDEALKLGVMALFSEKYGDTVRVVNFGDISKELCGGLHVKNSSFIGSFVITSVETIAKGVRRIEAYTGLKAVEKRLESSSLLKELTKYYSCKEDEIIFRIKDSPKKEEAKTEFIKEEEVVYADNKAKIFQFRGDLKNVKTKGDEEINKYDLVVAAGDDKGTVIVWSKKNKARDLLNFILQGVGKGGGSDKFAQGGCVEPFRFKDLLDKISQYFANN